jgi:hypothetical protein
MRFIITALPLLLLSCISSHLPAVDAKDTRKMLSTENYTNLNGSYQIMSVDSLDVSLDYYLTFKGSFDYIKKPGLHDFVTLTFLNEHFLNIKVYENETLTKSKIMKVKLSNGSFLCNRRVISPFYVAFNVFRDQKMRISCTANGDLLIDLIDGSIGFLFFIPIPLSGTSNQNFNLVYKKINQYQ